MFANVHISSLGYLWYHVNKYRATRGNRSELAPARKSPRCHVNIDSDAELLSRT